MDNNIEQIKKLYILTELKYIKINKDIPEEELFPSDWYSTTNYLKKIEILGEAIKTKSLIKDTTKETEYNGTPKSR